MPHELAQHGCVDVVEVRHVQAADAPPVRAEPLKEPLGPWSEDVEHEVCGAWAEADPHRVALSSRLIDVVVASVADHRRPPHGGGLAGDLAEEAQRRAALFDLPGLRQGVDPRGRIDVCDGRGVGVETTRARAARG